MYLTALRQSGNRVEALLLLGAYAGAFLIPLKLSISYVALIPTLIAWLWLFVKVRASAPQRFVPSLLQTGGHHNAPLLFFLAAAGLASAFGIHVFGSIFALAHLAFFSLIIFFYGWASKLTGALPILLALAAGQTISALYSVLESASPETFPRIFLGAVTESGQLALVVPMAVGLLLRLRRDMAPEHVRRCIPGVLLGIGNLSLLFALGFWRPIGISESFLPVLGVTAGIAILLSLAAALRLRRRAADRFPPFFLTALVLPILLCALVMNLKRGPWVGTFVACVILLCLYARRLIPLLIAAAVLLVVFVDPVRTRLQRSAPDFFIAGGRSVIWEIGGELSLRYPVGIGFGNSDFLRAFDREIPPELRHFHNNFLNILVETGWAGLLLFLWWIIAVVRAGLSVPIRRPDAPLAHGIASAAIAWQVAGLVEYNFGDSEVFLVAAIFVGTLASIKARSDRKVESTADAERAEPALRSSQPRVRAGGAAQPAAVISALPEGAE